MIGKANLIAVVFFVLCMLFGGLFLSLHDSVPAPTDGTNPSSLRPVTFKFSPLDEANPNFNDRQSNDLGWLRSVRYISFFHYAYDALMVNEFQDLYLLFTAPGYQPVPINGNVFLQTLSIDEDNFYTDIGALSAMIAVFQILTFVGLKFFNKASR